ncbi:glycosyltransferase [Legionella gratiana]|uniref:glycosyltransferase n=1 Tax=Legionella gratiana TaxID=45066 RepID=UPI003B75C179
MNHLHPLVSIVIPAYNGMPYLEEAIESVLSQDYPNIELIVLDDGSTDNTFEFLKKYKGTFYFDSHANMGQAATLNKGWQLSRGDIIGYLSADDLLTKNAVSTTVNAFLENTDIVLTYPDNYVINSKSEIIRKHTAPEYDYYDFIIHAKCRIGVGAFFLKSAFNQIGGWDSKYRLMPDYAYQLRLAKIGKFKYIPQVLGYSRLHAQALSLNKVSPEAADEFITLMKNEFKMITDEKLINIKDKILSRSYLFSARTHLESGRYKTAIHYIATAIKLDLSQLLKQDFYRITLNAFLKKIYIKKIQGASK